MLKARSKRLALRQVLVGRTVFEFDGYGYCEVSPTVNRDAAYDFEKLCKQNGVHKIVDEPKPEPKPEPKKVEKPTEVKEKTSSKKVKKVVKSTTSSKTEKKTVKKVTNKEKSEE